MVFLIVIVTVLGLITKVLSDNMTLSDSPFDKFDSLRILTELPLDKLLKVKNSMNGLTGNELDVVLKPESGDPPKPEAMALMADDEDPLRRTDIFHKDKKGGKINTLFMLTISSLAFLAFGGYLLCLIVQAIKSKGNVSMNTTDPAQQFMFLANSVKKKPQINYGRKRRDVEGMNSEDMYKVLITLAEGYAAWNH